MNMQLALARSAAADADSKWQEHRMDCPPCVRAQRTRRLEEMRTPGWALYRDRRDTAATLAKERELAKAPIPGQGGLWTNDELAAMAKGSQK